MRKRKNITTRMILKVLAVLYAVDTVIPGVWFTADFPKPTHTLEAAHEFPGSVDRVACRSQSFIFSALLLFWKAVVLALGLCLSFLSRNVSADFQESIWIFSASVLVTVCCLVDLPLAYLVDMAAAPFYSLLAGSLLLCTAWRWRSWSCQRCSACRQRPSPTARVPTRPSSRARAGRSLATSIAGDGDDGSSDATSTLGGGCRARGKKYPLGAHLSSSSTKKYAVATAVVQPHT